MFSSWSTNWLTASWFKTCISINVIISEFLFRLKDLNNVLYLCLILLVMYSSFQSSTLIIYKKKKRFLLTLYSQLAFTCSSISIADFEQVFTQVISRLLVGYYHYKMARAIFKIWIKDHEKTDLFVLLQVIKASPSLS